MRPLIALAGVLISYSSLCANPAHVDGAHMLEQYRARRAALRKSLADGVTILFGRSEQDEDLRNPFFQESNFLYLTGWQEPGAILVLAPLQQDSKDPGYETSQRLPREILFIPERDPDREKWTGRMFGPGDPNIREITGFSAVLPAGKLEGELRLLLDRYQRIYTLTDQPSAERLKQAWPLKEISSAAPALARLRMNKSPEEIALIQRATDATVAAHRAAWRRAAPGLYEYQVAATVTEVYSDKGCEGAYTPIVASGPNSVYLHYSRNSRRMAAGDILVMDVGAECSDYASDVTRTIPISGKFTPRQREIYAIVLGAQKAAIAALKPGMTLSKTAPHSLYGVAYNYINSHGRDLHGERLGKYLTHGIGHHVGLEVHDAADPNAPLEAGMVITIEPGIYLPEENLGVRIEDVVLVTEHGARILSGALPREPGDIEKYVGPGMAAASGN